MIVFDGYKSYLSVQFEQFYKEKCIIILYLFIYFLHLIQLLDVDYFNMLKRSYSQGFEDFIKAYINYIIKTEFFIAFKVAHFNTITFENIKVGFRSVGLMLYDLQVVISKLDIKLRTPTSTGLFLFNVDL